MNRIAAMACAAAWLALVALPGCGQKRPRPADQTPALMMLQQSAGGGTISVADLGWTQPGATVHLVVDEDGFPVDEITITRRPTDEHDARVAIDQNGRTQFLRTDDAENLVLTAVIERDDKAISLFDPPLIVAFASMPLGKQLVSDSKMRVLHLNRPAQERESGTARRTMTYVGDQTIQTPLGRFDARRIEIRLTADLKLADAEERSTLWVVAGHGIVAEQSSETVKVLGAFGTTKRRNTVLAEIASRQVPVVGDED